MRARFLLGAACGAAFAVAAVLACGDDSPGGADAAVDAAECSCPAAEAPLAGRVMRRESRTDITANSGGAQRTSCGPSEIPLGGGCSLVQVTDIEQVRLIQAGPAADGSSTQWVCRWFNGTGAQVTGVATLNCLVPAAQ
jgi:hypothetical protein